MSEVKKAYQEFWDNAFHESLKPTISEKAKAIAMVALREKEKRDNGCVYCRDPASVGFYLKKHYRCCPMCGCDLVKGTKDLK